MADDRGLHVFLVAGEESGDRLGAALMRALKARTDVRVRFSGVGGDHMAAEGLASLFPLDRMAIIGFAAIAGQIAAIRRRIRETAEAAIAANPDVLVIIDSPEFTHRVARKVRADAPSIPIVDYVSPSVWAWRPGRARAMRGYVDHVMALLPFEPAVHARLGGPPCTFVGHPLAERVDVLRPNAQEQRRRETRPPVVLLMPGSRKGELRRMLHIFAGAIERLAASAGALEVVVASVPRLAPMLAQQVASWSVKPRVISDQREKEAAFRTARLAIVKSGTGTLELALARVPMVATYRLSFLEAAVYYFAVKVPSVILANLVIGENVVPEFLQYNATPKNLADATLPLLADGPERRRQLDAFARLDAIMEIGDASPSDRAAAIVIGQATNRRG
jgi:lipid-A-disaccharide synthase